MSRTVEVEYFTDPFSGRCWASEPLVRRLQFAFEALEWEPRMTLLLPGPDDGTADVAHRSLEAAHESSMPTVADPWTDPPSSRRACAAVAAVRERSPDAAMRYLRRARERVFALGNPPTSTLDLVAMADRVDGIDGDALASDLEDGTASDALAGDLERARWVADRRDRVGTRGTVGTLPLAPRADRDGGSGRDGGAGRDAAAERQAEESTGAGVDGGEASPEGATANGAASTDGAESGGSTDGAEPEDSTDGSEPERLAAPPAILFRAGEDRILAAPAGRYAPLKDAVNTLEPDLTNALADPTPYGAKELKRRGMGLPDEFAEQVIDKDYASLVERYLSRFEHAFLPEVVAGVDATADTCRRALGELRDDGRIETTAVGEWTAWRTVDDAPR